MVFPVTTITRCLLKYSKYSIFDRKQDRGDSAMSVGNLNQTEAGSNDYHVLPASEKQLRYARQIAMRKSIVLPYDAQMDRRARSDWIDRKKLVHVENRYANYPSSKQVAFAEQIARRKRRDVPDECFKDRGLMSAWITHNK